MAFQQEDFEYQDLFTENSYLADVIHHHSPPQVAEAISADLKNFSSKASGEILELMWTAESNPPTLTQYSHWGKRIDRINVDAAWNQLHAVSAQEGMIAIAYERKSKEYSRLHQFLKLMIFHPSSAFYTCPLAMTDGATRVLELEKGKLHGQFFKHFLARDPKIFWTAGQWMTEKTGGSDVSQSETIAEEKGGRYYLHGTKWFTSAVTAEIAMALAQTPVDGKNRLSLFMIKLRNEKGELNNIEVLRLKDKLGTKAMPTAELQLQGVEGFLIGELGSGVKNIATVLNISRLYTAMAATGTIYRLHSLIRDYSQKRIAFGKKLIDHPLHQLTLVNTQAITNACVLFITEMAQLLGKSEVGTANGTDQNLLRLFTPIAKLWTSKNGMAVTSELIEAFGGAGYIEDTQLPRFLRDAQVFPIWEGTTNILSLDTIRAIAKGEVFAEAVAELQKRLRKTNESFASSRDKVEKILVSCKEWFAGSNGNNEEIQFGARTFAMALGDVFAATLMLEFASKTQKKRDQVLAKVFVGNIQVPQFEKRSHQQDEFKQTLLS